MLLQVASWVVKRQVNPTDNFFFDKGIYSIRDLDVHKLGYIHWPFEKDLSFYLSGLISGNKTFIHSAL